MRVLNFDDFSKIYEAETGEPISEDAKSILLQIGVLFFNAYGYMLALTKDYPDTVKDFQSVIAASAEAKPEELKKIANNVAAQITEEFKKEGVDKLWVDAAVKTADAFASLMSQFKDNKEAMDSASSMLNNKITAYIELLQKKKAQMKQITSNELKAVKDFQSASVDFEDASEIFEGFFTTKKGSVRNIKKQANVVSALLDAEVENEGIKPEVQKLQTEVTGILANLAKLDVGKKEDIDPKKLDDISNRLTEIPLELNKKKEAMAKTNKSFADASTLFVKALNAANRAITKEAEVKDKLAAEALKAKEAEEKAGQSTIRLPRNITRAAIGSKEDETVGKVQQLIIDKFKDNPDVNVSELFKKFAKFGADKRFGGTTAGMIVALKAGFGLDDTTPDITQELLDELTKVKLKESENVIVGFSKFSAIMEDFDPAKFKAAATGANPAVKSEINRADINKAVSNKNAGKEELSKEQAAKIEDLVNKKFDEEKKARVKEKLIELGAKEAKNTKDGAIAWWNTMRFFPNGTFWRSTTGRYGKYPSDLSKGLDTVVTDENGKESTLGKEVKNTLGPLADILKNVYSDINGSNPRNKELYSNVLSSLSKRELASIARTYKYYQKRGLLDDLDSEWTNTKEIREFTRKFADILKAEN
jgi:hypothetical protein